MFSDGDALIGSDPVFLLALMLGEAKDRGWIQDWAWPNGEGGMGRYVCDITVADGSIVRLTAERQI